MLVPNASLVKKEDGEKYLNSVNKHEENATPCPS